MKASTFDKIKGIAFVVALLLCSVAALADDQDELPRRRRVQPSGQQQPADPDEPQPVTEDLHDASSTHWGLALMGGLSTGAGSSYTITTPTLTTTATDSTNSGAFLGGELAYDIIPYLALGLDFEWTRYNYNNTTLTPDSELSILLVPRAQFPYEGLLFWGGLGLGATVTSIGTTTANTGPIIPGASSTTAGFTVSPRAGVDYKISDQIFVGGMFAYVNTRGNLSTSTTAVSGVSSVTLTTTESFTRSWVEFGGRIGVRF